MRYDPIYDGYLEEQLEVNNWAARNGADVWNPDEIPPPVGDVYARYGRPAISCRAVVLIAAAICVVLGVLNRLLIN